MIDPSAITPVVLVVDDEALLRLDATEGLSASGYLTYAAGGASEALQLLNKHPDISVLFTDINMPGEKDGLALAKDVHAARPDIQLIITSGRGRPAPIDIPDDGHFIAKPYDLDVVSEIVRTHRASKF